MDITKYFTREDKSLDALKAEATRLENEATELEDKSKILEGIKKSKESIVQSKIRIKEATQGKGGIGTNKVWIFAIGLGLALLIFLAKGC